MTADIIILPIVRVEREPERLNLSNGAREALGAIADALPITLDSPNYTLCWPDWLLAELWARGFKVVPLE